MSKDTTSIFTAVHLEVTPLHALVDEPVTIRLSGLPLGQTVTLRALSRDVRGEEWTSFATFVAGNNYEVDLASQQPIEGSYRTIDPMGLFWSMTPTTKKSSPALFLTDTRKPVEIDLHVEVDGIVVAEAHLERQFVADGVACEPVQEQGLVGVFSHPAGSGPYPTIIILGGSDGHICENQAVLLASHGYAVLALAYFGAEGLPKNLVHIPLEYFETALHWLQAQNIVNSDKIGVIGLSRGGELALLLGSIFPAIKAVVAGSPSGLIQAGIDGNNYSRSAWMHHGNPLQQAVVKFTPLLAFRLTWQSFRQQSFPMRDMFLTTLKDCKHLKEATILVENTQGPILLISGDDDQLWPSTVFSDLVMKRLAEHHHPYADQHLHYRGAGHFVCFPYGYPFLPPITKRIQGLAVGGTVDETAASVVDSWSKILTFFDQLSDTITHDATTI